MTIGTLFRHAVPAVFLVLTMGFHEPPLAVAQEQAAAADTSAAAGTAAVAPDPLSEDEMEVLVARIALYPDELVAVISEASLFPLQIVEASRFLDQVAKDKTLKPKDSWDGSVISLLNYPEVVRMMSDDLDWTQAFGDALTYQQKDVLIAIQQLRDKAVAGGVIKSDDKIKVVEENDNVVIQSASPEVIYVPQYAPEMLYEPGYSYAPITYYPDPYPAYYYPTAPYFAAFVTGAIWGAAVDWDHWGVWGGRWDGGDIDIDCNHCFNNIDINGKVNFNDVDWRNVDRSKINFDKNQFAKMDRTNIKNRVTSDNRNSFKNKVSEVRRDRPATRPGKSGKVSDVRKSKIEQGLKAKPGKAAAARPAVKKSASGSKVNRSSNTKAAAKKVTRPSGKPKPAARIDNRPRKPSGLGSMQSGKREKIASNRGGRSMGGGNRGGGGHKMVRRGGGGGGGGRRR